MSSEASKPGKSEAFVKFTLEQCQKGRGSISAELKRADNPATEYQCWEHLAVFHINLEKGYERLPYATIAAAIAKAKADHNGSIGIGRAITLCYEDGNNSDQAKAKLRRLLACESVERSLPNFTAVVQFDKRQSRRDLELYTTANRFTEIPLG